MSHLLRALGGVRRKPRGKKPTFNVRCPMLLTTISNRRRSGPTGGVEERNATNLGMAAAPTSSEDASKATACSTTARAEHSPLWVDAWWPSVPKLSEDAGHTCTSWKPRRSATPAAVRDESQASYTTSDVGTPVGTNSESHSKCSSQRHTTNWTSKASLVPSRSAVSNCNLCAVSWNRWNAASKGQALISARYKSSGICSTWLTAMASMLSACSLSTNKLASARSKHAMTCIAGHSFSVRSWKLSGPAISHVASSRGGAAPAS
mmetsp:Transcript_45776/g.127005  ORF Transcript_45776/g.127005 Transcript_45776/m.127005 type:complete len:263 (+) Transcript_45776:468-1256(+)